MTYLTSRFVFAGLIAIAVLIGSVTSFIYAQGQTVTTEVRVAARYIEDGDNIRAEFGIQQREAGGEWGEIILPRVNKYTYRDSRVGNWVYTREPTILEVAVPELAISDLLVVSGTGSGVQYTTLEEGRYRVEITEDGAGDFWWVSLNDADGTCEVSMLDQDTATADVFIGGSGILASLNCEPGTIGVEMRGADRDATWSVTFALVP